MRGGKEGALANENEATVAPFVGWLCMADATKVGMACPYFQLVNAFSTRPTFILFLLISLNYKQKLYIFIRLYLKFILLIYIRKILVT